jgi:hypothetical protein
MTDVEKSYFWPYPKGRIVEGEVTRGGELESRPLHLAGGRKVSLFGAAGGNDDAIFVLYGSEGSGGRAHLAAFERGSDRARLVADLPGQFGWPSVLSLSTAGDDLYVFRAIRSASSGCRGVAASLDVLNVRTLNVRRRAGACLPGTHSVATELRVHSDHSSAGSAGWYVVAADMQKFHVLRVQDQGGESLETADVVTIAEDGWSRAQSVFDADHRALFVVKKTTESADAISLIAVDGRRALRRSLQMSCNSAITGRWVRTVVTGHGSAAVLATVPVRGGTCLNIWRL